MRVTSSPVSESITTKSTPRAARSRKSYWKLYVSEGCPSIPPEQLLSALLLQVLYGIRSERQLMQQLDYNLLYRWFVGLSPDDLCGTRPCSRRTATGFRAARYSPSS